MTCIRPIVATSSDLLNGPKGGFDSPDLMGAIELGRRKAWEETNASLKRFSRLEVCTIRMLEDVKACLKLGIVSHGELI